MDEDDAGKPLVPPSPKEGELVAIAPARSHLPRAEDIPQAFTPAPIEIDTAKYIKANALVSSKYSLPLNAHRILSYILAQLHAGWEHDDSLPLMRIAIQELVETFPGLTGTHAAYAEIEKALNQLYEAEISVKHAKGFIRMRWAPTCGRDGPWVFIRLSEDLRPYLRTLTKQFTVYRLHFVTQLRTAYQYRFYEMFKAQLFRGKMQLMVDQLRLELEIPSNEYKLVGHFKESVLVPSIKGINDVTDLRVELLDPPIKQGRRIIGWNVSISLKPQEQLPLPPTVAPIIEKLVALGISPEEAQQFAKEYEEEFLQQTMAWVEREHDAGKIDSVSGFLRAAIKGEWKHTPSRELKQLEAAQRQQQANLDQRARTEHRQRVEEARRDAPAAIRYGIANKRYTSATKAEKVRIHEAFAVWLEGKARNLVDTFQSGGLQNPRVAAWFRIFLPEHYSVPEPDLATIQRYVEESTMPAAPPE